MTDRERDLQLVVRTLVLISYRVDEQEVLMLLLRFTAQCDARNAPTGHTVCSGKKITLTKLQICDLTITVRETQTSVQQNNKKLLFKIMQFKLIKSSLKS